MYRADVNVNVMKKGCRARVMEGAKVTARAFSETPAFVLQKRQLKLYQKLIHNKENKILFFLWQHDGA